jgi:beta-phosphoglucomutase
MLRSAHHGRLFAFAVHPEIFFRAAESLGIPFGNCVGVEDARAGIAAVKAAGMFAVGIGTDLPGADWILSDTADLVYEELARRFGNRSRA